MEPLREAIINHIREAVADECGQYAAKMDAANLTTHELETTVQQQRDHIARLESDLADQRSTQPSDINALINGLRSMIRRYESGQGSYGGTGIADELRMLIHTKAGR